MGEQINKILRPVSTQLAPNPAQSIANISEAVADDDATVIGINVPNDGQSKTTTYTFGFPLPLISQEIEAINSVGLFIRARTSTSAISSANLTFQGIMLYDNLTPVFSVPESQQKALTSSYQNFIFESQNFKNKLAQELNKYINSSSLEIDVGVNIKGTSQSGKNSSSFDIRITQVYLQINYTTVSNSNSSKWYIKEGDKWSEFGYVYRKESGKWRRYNKFNELLYLPPNKPSGEELPKKYGKGE